MRGTYHAATSRRHTRTNPPMSPPMMKFSANSAAPPPGTIQTHIRWMPKGRPQSIQSQRRSSSPFLMQADLKIQYSSPAMATGKTAFLKNSLMASVLVIGGTSIPASIIPGKSDRAQGFLKSLVKAHNLRYSSSLFRCLCGSASLGFSSRASTFWRRVLYSRSSRWAFLYSDCRAAFLAVSSSISARSRWVAGRGTASRRFSSLAAASNRMIQSCSRVITGRTEKEL